MSEFFFESFNAQPEPPETPQQRQAKRAELARKARESRQAELKRQEETVPAIVGATRKATVLTDKEIRHRSAIAWIRERLLGRLIAGAPFVTSNDAREEWRNRDPKIFTTVEESDIFGAIFHDKRFEWNGNVDKSTEPSHNARIIKQWRRAAKPVTP